jgi:hypothetical protein
VSEGGDPACWAHLFADEPDEDDDGDVAEEPSSAAGEVDQAPA